MVGGRGTGNRHCCIIVRWRDRLEIDFLFFIFTKNRIPLLPTLTSQPPPTPPVIIVSQTGQKIYRVHLCDFRSKLMYRDFFTGQTFFPHFLFTWRWRRIYSVQRKWTVQRSLCTAQLITIFPRFFLYPRWRSSWLLPCYCCYFK